MAKFKKNFWSGSTPEPEWYARQYDPTDKFTQSQGFKEEHNPRPAGALIPRALVGGVETPIKQAFEIYKAHCVESIRLNFPAFKTALINGTKIRTTKGLISKP